MNEDNHQDDEGDRDTVDGLNELPFHHVLHVSLVQDPESPYLHLLDDRSQRKAHTKQRASDAGECPATMVHCIL